MKHSGVPPFIELLEPLVETARKQLEHVRATSERHVTAEAWKGAEEALLRRLSETAGPALLGAFRAEAHLPPAAHLTSITPDWVPRARYDAFLARGLDGWPALVRRLHRVADEWRSAVSALVGHLASDEQALRAWHRPWRRGVPSVAAIELGLSDPHAGGRTVARLTFADGRSLAYKPRSLAAEAAFGRLLRGVAGRCGAPRQRVPWVLDRGDHGWMEWLTPEPCRSRTDAEAFYERCGGLLAVLEVLRGGDIHPDNLIAAGAYPVIVDLECLFQPGPADLARPDPLDDPLAFTSGALPVFTSFDGGRTLHPIAAFGCGALPARPGQRLRHPGTDWIHLAPVEVSSFDANGPSLDGVALDVRDHVDALVRGYRASLAAVLARRDALLAPRGALRRFRRTALRLLCAPTNLYALLLDSALSTEGVSDEDSFRARLARAAQRDPTIADVHCWSAVLAEEARALDRLDVPAFVFRPAQRSARAAAGGTIGRVFAAPMFERVERALRALDGDGLDDRAVLLRAALRRPAAPAASEPTAVDARATLRTLADRVADLAAPQAGGAVTWVRLWEVMPAPVAPVGPGLCYGVAGIAVFLAEAGRVLDDDALTRLAVG
ncbi:DUF4135 domain-containing protein, partial [Azospirillum sp. TSO22-1]|uniref:DUF4135 domain-containing protein n=1 Tax=Azospirillum sp. TSO22-1 TaxID=716789 RepID=UPI000D60BDF6